MIFVFELLKTIPIFEFDFSILVLHLKKGILILSKEFVNRFLILVLGFEILTAIFIIGYRATEIKTEIENPDLGRVFGDDIEATGWAGSLNSEIQAQYLDLYMVEYDKPFYPIAENDRYVIECIVAGEAKGEPIEGKMAVAQCLLNAMAKDGLSASEARKKYQYSGWDDELQNSNPDCWVEVCEAVSRVFDDGEFVSENPILYFYAPKRVYSRWHESLNHAVTVGGHKFFYLDEDVNADWFLNLKGVD